MKFATAMLAVVVTILAGMALYKSGGRSVSAKADGNCASLSPLLDVLPQEGRMHDLPATYRGCPPAGADVLLVYGGDDGPAEYKFEMQVLKAGSAYLADRSPQRDMSQFEASYRADLDECIEESLNPGRNVRNHRLQRTFGGFDFCFDREENNSKVHRTIWTAVAIRGDVYLKVGASGKNVQELDGIQAAMEHLEPTLAGLKGDNIQ